MHGPTFWITFLAALALLPTSAAQAFDEAEEMPVVPILSITDAKEYQKVMDSGAAWMLGLYHTEQAPSSEEHTRGMLTEMHERLFDLYGTHFAMMDCSQKAVRKVCRSIPAQKTIPGVAFATEQPAWNPYTKKMHRNLVIFDGNPAEIKAVERQFSKSYPRTAGIPLMMKGFEEESLPAGEEALVVMSPRDSVNLFTKSVCQAFPSLKCVQLGPTVLTMDNAMKELSQLMHMDDTEEHNALYTIGHMAADGTLSIYQPQGGKAATQKERSAVLAFLGEKSGLTPEAGAVGVPKGDKDAAGEGADAIPDGLTHNGSPILEHKAEDFDGELSPIVSWVVRVGYQESDDGKGRTAAAWKSTMGATCEGAVMPMHLLCPHTPEGAAEAADLASFGAKLCSRRALPFVAVVPHYGTSAARKGPEALPVFELAEKAEIKRAAVGSLPEETVHVIGEQDLEAILQKGSAQNKLTLIVLSDKEEPPAMLRNVAVALDRFALVSFLSEPSEELLARMGKVTKLPAVLVGAPQPLDAPDRVEGGITILGYDPAVFGPIRYSGIQNFVLSAYQRSGLHELTEEGKAKSGSSSDPHVGDVSGPLQKELLPVSSPQEWAAQCSTDYKGLCVVGLLANSDDPLLSAAAGVLTRSMKRLGKQGAAFRFLSVNGDCQATFAGRFDVQVDTLPRVIVFSPSKRRYMALTGTFDESSITAFLQSVTAGKAASTSIPQWPEFAAECEYVEPVSGDAGAVEEMGDEDMDDLLAEIRRDEEAAAGMCAVCDVCDVCCLCCGVQRVMPVSEARYVPS